MRRNELKDLKERVSCAAALEKAGFAVDLRESTRRAVKYRRDGQIIIVIHSGQGWFDPLSDAKGDVFSLVERLDRVGFASACERVAALVGYTASEPIWTRPVRIDEPDPGIAERWYRRLKPYPGSRAWRYLAEQRCLPDNVLRLAIRQNRLREGPYASMWAAHCDASGAIVGWEERGPDWRGFSSRGSKVLFRFGPSGALRICVTEAAIDALSLAAIERCRLDSLYVSTGGGWSPTTEEAIRSLARRQADTLIAATDNDEQGDVYAARLEAITAEVCCGFERLRPRAVDWNAVLKAKEKEEKAERRRA